MSVNTIGTFSVFTMKRVGMWLDSNLIELTTCPNGTHYQVEDALITKIDHDHVLVQSLIIENE